MVCMIDYVSFRIIVPHINIFYSFNDIMQLISQKYVNFDFFQFPNCQSIFLMIRNPMSNLQTLLYTMKISTTGAATYMKNEHSQLLITWSMHTEKSAVHATYS